jgi:predicted dinucleotide-binding enzyme
MTTIGFIGAGSIGGTVARLAAAAGYDVIVSNSRGPETLAALVAELGPRARAAVPTEAAAASDIVVVSVPLHAYQSIPAEPLAGRVVVDTSNYYPQRDGEMPQLDGGASTTGELLQQHLGEAKVVKAFNNIFYRHLQVLGRPSGSTDRTALPIAGDDPDARARVTAFLDAIGYDAVDAGPLGESRRFQPGTPAYGVVYAGGQQNFADSPGIPASAQTVVDALNN